MLENFEGLTDSQRLEKIREYAHERADSCIRYMFEWMEKLYKGDVGDDTFSITEIADAPVKDLPKYINIEEDFMRAYVAMRLKSPDVPGRELLLTDEAYDLFHEDMRERMAKEGDQYFDQTEQELSTLIDIAERLGDKKLLCKALQFYFDY